MIGVVIGIEIENEHDTLAVGWASQSLVGVVELVVEYESEIENDDCFDVVGGCENWSEIDDCFESEIVECHGLSMEREKVGVCSVRRRRRSRWPYADVGLGLQGRQGESRCRVC